MSLTDIVSKELSRVKNFLFTPKEKQDMIKYLADVELKDYFDKAPEEQRRQLYSRLEHHLDNSMKKYASFADSWYSKAANIGGIATVLADAYQALLSKVPLTGSQYLPLHKLLVIAKSLAEVPYMYNYFKESKDLFGVLKWLAMKPIELAIPILGPLLGVGWTEKIVRQRIMYEAKTNFLEELGLVPKEQPYKLLDNRAEKVTGYAISPRYTSPVPQYV